MFTNINTSRSRKTMESRGEALVRGAWGLHPHKLKILKTNLIFFMHFGENVY